MVGTKKGTVSINFFTTIQKWAGVRTEDYIGAITLVMASKRDAEGRPETHDIDDRWVGTGRTIFDNKGNPIKKYEPFFSETISYEDEQELVERGVTPILHYDPVGRLVRADQPNGTFARVEFDAWTTRTWDENDTVKESLWYADRGSPTLRMSVRRRAVARASCEHVDVHRP